MIVKKFKPGSAGFFAVLLIFVALVGGWIANIVKLFGMTFDPITGEAVLRVIGIFFLPLGVIAGYL